ncbi:MAG TPA: hypothetical protein VK434_19495 [Microvirga sp.]|nr:hypothetical protein [Microvirga sp.]
MVVLSQWKSAAQTDGRGVRAVVPSVDNNLPEKRRFDGRTARRASHAAGAAKGQGWGPTDAGRAAAACGPGALPKSGCRVGQLVR